MNRRLSDWSKPGENPPMVAVWETCDPRFTAKFYQHWNGTFYGVCSNSPQDAYRLRNFSTDWPISETCFRGLADKPE